MKFCSNCGNAIQLKKPTGDQKIRHVCSNCHKIHYQNPLIITGCLPIYQQKVLLCRRAIEPKIGYWTLPAGFLELGESIEQGAIRETYEEAGTQVKTQQLYTLFNLLDVGQVSVFYLANMTSPDFKAGIESLEVKLFDENEIPWHEIAFSTSKKTLQYYFIDRTINQFKQRIKTYP